MAEGIPRFERLPDVTRRTGLGRSTIYRRVQAKTFPAPIPLGNGNIVGWIASEIDEWIVAQIAAARAPEES